MYKPQWNWPHETGLQHGCGFHFVLASRAVSDMCPWKWPRKVAGSAMPYICNWLLFTKTSRPFSRPIRTRVTPHGMSAQHHCKLYIARLYALCASFYRFQWHWTMMQVLIRPVQFHVLYWCMCKIWSQRPHLFVSRVMRSLLLVLMRATAVCWQQELQNKATKSVSSQNMSIL